jgi:hypothetical protein
MNGETALSVSSFFQLVCIVVSTLVVAFLTSKYANSGPALKRLMLLLIGSTMLVATIKMGTQVAWGIMNDKTISFILMKLFSVYLMFFLSAVYSWRFTSKN